MKVERASNPNEMKTSRFGKIRRMRRAPMWSATKQAEEDAESKRLSAFTLYKSPKSGWMDDIGVVHHQILKIIEEDSYLGKDVGEGLSAKEKLAVFNLASQMDSFILSRPILPCSPLSGKTTIKSRR